MKARSRIHIKSRSTVAWCNRDWNMMDEFFLPCKIEACVLHEHYDPVVKRTLLFRLVQIEGKKIWFYKIYTTTKEYR